MSENPYYIITGAPSTGKTSILEGLEKRGYACHKEIARQVIRENLDTGLEVFPWNQMKLFSDMVLNRMIQLTNSFQPNELCFLDRGMVDLIGYMDFANQPIPENYILEAKRLGYAKKVFFLPIWADIYTNDEERKESLDEAKAIGSALYNAYERLGFELIEVPKGSVVERIDFIEQQTMVTHQ
ncbi:MAG: putative ATPase [Parvicella sp.]|jgi:predicted ATPase